VADPVLRPADVPDRALVLHFDLDSPAALLRFWGGNSEAVDLEDFFQKALGRALEFLDAAGTPATFFCVGRELEGSPTARRLLGDAHRRGHELGNHTYSHPYGLTLLSESDQEAEVRECTRVIRDVTGHAPIGFRAPGYDLNTRLMNLLEAEGFLYDSSVFWSILNPLFRLYHRCWSTGDTHNGLVQHSRLAPRRPYFPSRENWIDAGPPRAILELPLPRVGACGWPFYNNFLLSVGPGWARRLVAQARQRHLVYLFHLIEFVDLSDGLPDAIRRHPNVQVSVRDKIQRMNAIVSQLRQRYEVQRTTDFVAGIRAGARAPEGY
jgi:peptidoglycan/xylan/chitin deacetylase (PgdA/CDA1 family)